MHLFQGFIFIWIALHHTRIIKAASLRNEYLDTNLQSGIKSHPDQKFHNSHVEPSVFYLRNNENSKFRPMLPYERRNRPIFTSKTYFGKNQMKELPRKYWENKEDQMISPLTVKSARPIHPLKYIPQRSARVEFNHQNREIPKVQFHKHKVQVPDRNAEYDSKNEYGQNPQYVPNNNHGQNPQYVPNNNHGHNPQYVSNNEYGQNPQYVPNNEYGQNPQYAHNNEYGQNPQYAHNNEYGQNPQDAPNNEYGHNPQYAPNNEYGHYPQYAPKKEYGHNPQYAPKNEYGHNPQYAPKNEYGHNPQYALENEYGHNPQYALENEYGHNPQYALENEYGHNPQYAPRNDYTNQGHASRNEYGANQGYALGEEHGTNQGYASRDEYGANPGYASISKYEKPVFVEKDDHASKRWPVTNDEHNRDFEFDAKDGYFMSQRPIKIAGHDPETGNVPNAEYGSDPKGGSNIERGQNHWHPDLGTNLHTTHNLNPTRYFNHVYDSNFGYDPEDDIKKKVMEYRIEELQKDLHKVDMGLNEDIAEKMDVNEDSSSEFLDGYDLLHLSKDSGFIPLDNDAETSNITSSNSDFNIDENLKKDELLKHSDDEKFRKMPADITGDESEDATELVEEFEGSGESESELDDLNILDRKANKSARILDIFSRFDNSSQCFTPKNESGQCRGLTECPLIETMENFSSFLQYMCFQRGRIVGICCPDNPVIEVKDSVDEKPSEKIKLDIQQPPNGCGLSTNTRIVGGTMSVPHEFSWMVALLRRNRFYCGGVIINNWYILTAAHCVLGIKISDLKVRLGEFDFHQNNDIQQDIPVTQIKRHALFVTSTFQHDIALLKLKRRVEYTKFIGSICLPKNTDEDFSKKNATVAGWGTVSFGGAASPILRKVTVPVWDNKDCDRTYVFERINESFMCAGSSISGEDACQGDSGGPLMSMNDEGRWEVIGIVSWGRRCGDPRYPGVYTRVTSYLDWIAENAQ